MYKMLYGCHIEATKKEKKVTGTWKLSLKRPRVHHLNHYLEGSVPFFDVLLRLRRQYQVVFFDKRIKRQDSIITVKVAA